jgi:hypothetical protein
MHNLDVQLHVDPTLLFDLPLISEANLFVSPPRLVTTVSVSISINLEVQKPSTCPSIHNYQVQTPFIRLSSVRNGSTRDFTVELFPDVTLVWHGGGYVHINLQPRPLN